jgi:hypothetical protein
MFPAKRDVEPAEKKPVREDITMIGMLIFVSLPEYAIDALECKIDKH